MIVGIATDHGGYALKEELVGSIRAKGHEVVDVGAHQLCEGDDYPDYVVPLAQAVTAGRVERGIAICGQRRRRIRMREQDPRYSRWPHSRSLLRPAGPGRRSYECRPVHGRP